jgi:hypothetical protein
MKVNNKRVLILIVLVLMIAVGLVSFSCGLLALPAISMFAFSPTSTATMTALPTATPSPLPPIYVTLNVNEFSTYTLYWKRELWESAIRESPFVENFENDSSDYGEVTFPYLTGNGFLLNGESSAQILGDGSLLPSGNFIHFRDWGTGLRVSFPNNSIAQAFSFDYKASETWQLTFNDTVITIPGGRNRFLGVIVHNFFPGEFTLSSFERVQGGLTVDNISYVLIANVTAVPIPTIGSVTILASGGNVNIRRGPGADYDPIGALLDGQSSTATARNEKGTWIYIPVPGTPDQFGWINAVTSLSRVTGNIDRLPVMTMEPAEPAYVRNCTANPMLLTPGGIEINSQAYPPENVVLVFPGDYDVYDTTVPNSPAIKTILVREGRTIDLIEDGLKKTYSCP